MNETDTIEQNLKELLERKSREERKANGRLVAILVAFILIFVAVYHAWLRKTTVLAGVLVPALIMISYGGWVVILAKRDKQRQALFERHLKEITQKNKVRRRKKRISQIKQKTKRKSRKVIDLSTTTKLYYENEAPKQNRTATLSSSYMMGIKNDTEILRSCKYLRCKLSQNDQKSNKRMCTETGNSRKINIENRPPINVLRRSIRQKFVGLSGKTSKTSVRGSMIPPVICILPQQNNIVHSFDAIESSTWKNEVYAM